MRMTYYVIFQLFPQPKGWYPLDYGPDSYLTMKYKMQVFRKQNPGIKYRLMKTSY